MSSSLLIIALSTAALILGFVLFRLFCAAGRTNWRRWLFGEHNIPFN